MFLPLLSDTDPYKKIFGQIDKYHITFIERKLNWIFSSYGGMCDSRDERFLLFPFFVLKKPEKPEKTIFSNRNKEPTGSRNFWRFLRINSNVMNFVC